jgi:hypothetical protein
MNAPAFDLFMIPERVAPYPLLFGWKGQNWGFHILLPARVL